VVLIDRDVDGGAHDVVRVSRAAPPRCLRAPHSTWPYGDIGLISGPADISTAQERGTRFRDAMREHDLEAVPA